MAKTAGEADELWNFGIEFVKSSAVSQFFVAKNPKNLPGFILMWEGNPRKKICFQTLGFLLRLERSAGVIHDRNHDKSHDRSYVVFGGFEVWIFAESLPRLFFGLLIITDKGELSWGVFFFFLGSVLWNLRRLCFYCWGPADCFLQGKGPSHFQKSSKILGKSSWFPRKRNRIDWKNHQPLFMESWQQKRFSL